MTRVYSMPDGMVELTVKGDFDPAYLLAAVSMLTRQHARVVQIYSMPDGMVELTVKGDIDAAYLLAAVSMLTRQHARVVQNLTPGQRADR